MEAIEAVGTYFDGLSARPHPVSLRLTDRLAITGRDLRLDWDLATIAASETPPPITRIGVVGSAARVEFADEALAAGLAARCPDLHRAEANDGGRWRIALWSMAAGCSVLLLAVFGAPALAVRMAPLVPAGIEARLAAAVDGQILRLLGDPPECRDAPARAVLDRLVARMIEGHDLPAAIQLGVRRHAMANALTLPGGRVIVLSELIAKARNPDEFAAVLAHEFGHVAVRDPMRSLLQASGTSFLLSLVLGDLTGSTVIVGIGQAVISAGYSRDAERAADAYAVGMMTRAGGDGAALATILERIAKDDDTGGGLLRSHPFTTERAGRIRALAGTDSAGRRILAETDWAVLKGICRGSESRADPDR
ncbi:MAG TPA: M48 family metallopeptidase [Methylobacterium sp.]|jgi:Zn-dependent protease with chaperone function